jgi:hypothetical protein
MSKIRLLIALSMASFSVTPAGLLGTGPGRFSNYQRNQKTIHPRPPVQEHEIDDLLIDNRRRSFRVR